VIVFGVSDAADDRLMGLCFERVGKDIAVDAPRFLDRIEDQLPCGVGRQQNAGHIGIDACLLESFKQLRGPGACCGWLIL
jgi:hypothetical protein